jgi:transcription factor C subunit 6
VPKKKYTADAFDGIEHLINDPDVVDEGANLAANVRNGNDGKVNDAEHDDKVANDDDNDDDEFEADEVEQNDDEEEEEEEEGANDDNDNETISDIAEEEPIRPRAIVKSSTRRPQPNEPGYVSPSRKPRPRVPRHPNQLTPGEPDPNVYTRGYPSGLTQTPAKNIRRLYFFGPEDKAAELSDQVRRKYADGVCLPSRHTDAQGLGGFIVCDEWKREVQAAQENWAWYDEGGGKEMFKQGQIATELGEDETREYLQVDSSFTARKFVAGPIDSMAVFTLQIGEAMPLTTPFIEGQEQPNFPRDYKRGFILNLGERIQWLEWAPNQHDSRQFLAVATLPQHPDDEFRKQPSCGPRSFRPQPRFRSAIQIWEFVADKQHCVDNAVPPRRRITLCMAYGDVKVFKWCPVPCHAQDRMGLLACITGDGFLRLYDVPRPPEDDATSSNILLEEAAFAVTAPNTVYTCMTWLSSSRLAAGCANGCLAIWDLQSILSKKSNDTSSSPKRATTCRPVAYLSISTTYLLSVTSCYPTYPDILAMSSMTGYVTLLDLRARPTITKTRTSTIPPLLGRTALSSRARHGVHPLIYSALLKATLSGDDHGNLRASPLRMHHNFIGVGRDKAAALALAGSVFHPFVLMGTVAGGVMCTNPVGRIAGGGKVEIWQGRWFTHEWRRGRRRSRGEKNKKKEEKGKENGEGGMEVDAAADHDDHDDDRDDNADDADADDDEGLARIAEGYRSENVLLSRNTDPANIHDDVVFATIHEARAAITAVGWNGNLHVAGWAAAGMADGLLRVEDLAVVGGEGRGKRKSRN